MFTCLELCLYKTCSLLVQFCNLQREEQIKAAKLSIVIVVLLSTGYLCSCCI